MKLLPLLAMTILLGGCATAVTPGENTGDAGGAPKKDSGSVTPDAGKKVYDAGSTTPPDDSGVTNDDGGPIDDNTCAAQTSLAQCQQCCLTVHPTGYDVYHQELTSCACQAPAACASECANELCANLPTTTGDACEQCITASLTQGTGACYDGVSAACQGDPDCTALFSTCIPPCQNK